LVFRLLAKFTSAVKPQHAQSGKPKHWDVEEVVLWEEPSRAVGVDTRPKGSEGV